MKRFVIVSLLMLLVASMAFTQAKPGGIARQAAMGGSQAGTGLIINPFIVDDPALMLINPAYQTLYTNYGWSNIAGGAIAGTTGTGNDGYGNQNAGIAFSLNNEWNLGAILSYDPTAANQVLNLPSTFGGTQAIPAINNVWELLTSTKMSSMSFGFGVMYGSSNKTNKHSTVTPATSTENEASARMFGFRAGTIIDLGNENSLSASAALRLDKATDKKTVSPATTGTGGEYSASGTELLFGARAKFKASGKFNFVPYGQLGIFSAEPKEDTPPTGGTATTATSKYTGLAFGVGVGGEYHAQNMYIAGGLSCQYAQVKNEFSSGGATPTTSTLTANYLALPVVNLGAEWWFLDWLGGRIGYFRYIGTETYKSESATDTYENSSTGFATLPPGFPGVFAFPFPGVHSNAAAGGLGVGSWDGVVTLGVGMKFGGFSLDATISDEALRHGFGLIGSQNNINTFGYMTASYNFAD